jgi:hypothetical protein
MSNVIPFKRPVPSPESELHRYYSDLSAIKEITADLSHPATVILLTGLLCDWLYQRFGADEKARLEGLKEFVRGVRIEIRGR